MNMTQKETDCLKAIGNNGLENMGGNQYSDLLDDNYSWFDVSDLVKLMTGYTKHQIVGLISALAEKGLIIFNEGDWSLSEEGIEELINIS